MNFDIGMRLRVNGELYIVTGRITYQNRNDNNIWTEYQLQSQLSNSEKWLSCDDVYQEYSISEKRTAYVSTDGFHVVDEGVAEVVSAEGNVDVERGECFSFTEYEDHTEEEIISIERWEDEEEISLGYYLDRDEIEVVGNRYGSDNVSYTESFESEKGSRTGKTIFKIIIFLVIGMLLIIYFAKRPGAIARYLESNAMYDYRTSITGEDKEKADVYATSFTVEEAAKDIIDGIEGDTQDVQESEEEGDTSITILTETEYCIIYLSEDSETLVQISSRKYAYQNNHHLYHGHHYTNRFYRRYYYSRAFYTDSERYKKYSSPYSDYSDDTTAYDYQNQYSTYNSYSDSVRQSSVNSRTSSGGGLSSGK